MSQIADFHKNSKLLTVVAGDFNATVSQNEHNFSDDEPYSPGKNQPFLTKFLDKHKMVSIKEER